METSVIASFLYARWILNVALYDIYVFYIVLVIDANWSFADYQNVFVDAGSVLYRYCSRFIWRRRFFFGTWSLHNQIVAYQCDLLIVQRAVKKKKNIYIYINSVYPWNVYRHDDITSYVIRTIVCPSTSQAWYNSTMTWWDISEMGLSAVIICIVTVVSIVATSYSKRFDKYFLLLRVFISFLFVWIKIFRSYKNFHNIIS